MQKARWKGNVRELREHGRAADHHDAGRDASTSTTCRTSSGSRPSRRRPNARRDKERPGTLREFKESAERAFLVDKLRENNWNISKTAEVIGTPRSNLYKKLEQYGSVRKRTGRQSRRSRPDDDASAFAASGYRRSGPPQSDRRSPRRSADRARRGRKVRTPQGSAPGNARSGQPEGKWHRKYTARCRLAGSPPKPEGRRRGKGEKVR